VLTSTRIGEPHYSSVEAAHEVRYAIITAARDEATTLPRLAAALRTQTLLPSRWVIVENGSRDETYDVAEAFGQETPWIEVVRLQEDRPRERGGPIVRALHAGIKHLGARFDIVVNVDADVTMDDDYFECLVEAFGRRPSLGVASGSAWEADGGTWRQRFVTGGTVWGATRAYRWECLQDVLPLDERHGWDGIDQLKARARGWETAVLHNLAFYHHRAEGASDGSWSHWVANGETAHYMGYRPWYLVLRALHRMRSEPRAFGMLVGYAGSVLRRKEQLADGAARAVLRDDQRLGSLGRRRREALGATGQLDDMERTPSPTHVRRVR
jgi:poly-beta-1,6-N-acetyl-D-glucosamine synthase